jgi:transcriptional regulator with XRE-family HTH domain
MTSPARRAHGPTVRALRTALDRRLHDIAATAEVSVGFLSRIERGRETASAEVTARLAAALGVPVPVLTGQTPAVAALARILGVSTQALAAALGIAPARMTSIVEGVAGPTPQEVERLTVRLGVDAGALGLSESAVA